MKVPAITKATLKAFIRKNPEFYIRVTSSFDSMTDSVDRVDDTFTEAKCNSGMVDNTLGYEGIWLVGGSRNYFEAYRKDGFTGYRVSNCCGSFIVAIKE